MVKESVAADGAMEDAPSCDDKGGMDGRIKEGFPDSWEGEAEIRGRKDAAEGPTLGAGGAGRSWLQAQPGRGSVEGGSVIVKACFGAKLGGGGSTLCRRPTPTFLEAREA